MMKKRIILRLILPLLPCVMIGLNIPARAQWDLNGTAPNINSAGLGEAGLTHSQAVNGVPVQPYTTTPNAMPVYNQQTQYNHQWGTLNNSGFNQLQNPAYQAMGHLPLTSMQGLSNMQNNASHIGLPSNLKGSFNGLPPTSLDSFVLNAGGHAEAIYGDEGTNSWPPLSGLSRANTINAGIVGQRSKTITTGHGGSKLPAASGLGTSRSP